MTVRVTILLEGDGNYARFKTDYLDSESFGPFKEATEGVRYIRELRAWLAPVEQVGAIVVRLRNYKKTDDSLLFDIQEIDEKVRLRLENRSQAEWLDRRAMVQRIERIDQELFDKEGKRMFQYQKEGVE